jgi:hypothetical protein
MTPIVVAMEVEPNGTVKHEGFTVISDFNTVQGTVARLEKEFDSGFATWGAERTTVANDAIARGNRLVFRPFFF